MSTKTIYTDLEKLYNAGNEESSLIIRLMIACNDIISSNHALSIFKEYELKPTQEHIRYGYRMYFVRLQTGHLNEAIDLINELSNMLNTSKNLQNAYKKCSHENKEQFSKLLKFLPGNKNHDEFKKNVKLLRHKAVFHYGENKYYKKAISKRMESRTGKYSSITLSDDIRFSRFNIADEIIDTLVCRELWNLQDDTTLQDEADKRGQFTFDLCVTFANFCSEFSFHYIKEHGARS